MERTASVTDSWSQGIPGNLVPELSKSQGLRNFPFANILLYICLLAVRGRSKLRPVGMGQGTAYMLRYCHLGILDVIGIRLVPTIWDQSCPGIVGL